MLYVKTSCMLTAMLNANADADVSVLPELGISPPRTNHGIYYQVPSVPVFSLGPPGTT